MVHHGVRVGILTQVERDARVIGVLNHGETISRVISGLGSRFKGLDRVLEDFVDPRSEPWNPARD